MSAPKTAYVCQVQAQKELHVSVFFNFYPSLEWMWQSAVLITP